MGDAAAGGKGGKGKPKKAKGPPDIYKILRMIMERNYNPVIVFSFSKKECEQHALHMAKLDFSSGMFFLTFTPRSWWLNSSSNLRLMMVA